MGVSPREVAHGDVMVNAAWLAEDVLNVATPAAVRQWKKQVNKLAALIDRLDRGGDVIELPGR